MTCLAFDGRYLAADRGILTGGVYSEAAKVFTVKGARGPHVIALCGYWSFALKVKEYFESDTKCEFPNCGEYGLDKSDSIGLIVTPDMKCFNLYANGGFGEPSTIRWIANGSGIDFVSGALAAGAIAEEAISLAVEHTSYGNLGVDVIDCRAYFDEVLPCSLNLPF